MKVSVAMLLLAPAVGGGTQAQAQAVAEAACDGVAPGYRREGCTAGGLPSVAPVLLQQSARVFPAVVTSHAERKLVSMDEEVVDIQFDPRESGRLPLCHHSVVEQTCRRLNGAAAGEPSPSSISSLLLRDQLSASEVDLATLWGDLGLPAQQQDIACQRLCDAVVQHVRRVGHLPPSTDVACYKVDGTVHCDAAADPSMLTRSLAAVQDEPLPDDGPQTLSLPAGEASASQKQLSGLHLVQMATAARGSGSAELLRHTARKTRLSWWRGISWQRRAAGVAQRHLDAGAPWGIWNTTCPYTVWEMVERVASLFRMYPADDRDTQVSLPPGLALLQGGWSQRTPGEVKRRIGASNAQARAWVSTVLGEMEGKKAAQFRRKWFGGAGSPSDSEVRSRVLKTMNFIDRILLDGVHYVYPADEAQRSSCGGNTVAYVWRFQTGKAGYTETRGPVCDASQDPFRTSCGVDAEGRYFVYLCERWFERSGLNSQISTLVHEAAHHAGPGDQSYNKKEMRQFSRDRQLDNAASYQYFAQDVSQSAWGCADSENVTIRGYTCSSQGGARVPCQCAAFASLCTSEPKVRRQCPATCGECRGPSADSGSSVGGTATTTTTTFAGTISATSRTTPSPTTSTTMPPLTTAGAPAGGGTPSSTTCTEQRGRQQLTIGRSTYTGNCPGFKQNGLCEEGVVSEACPITCGVCSPPGCEDDPDFSIETSAGTLTCEQWQGYRCWEEVEESCPTSCRVDRCTR